VLVEILIAIGYYRYTMVSPYDILDVDSNTDLESIEGAYRERVKETHPDHGGSSKEFQLVQQAYEEIKEERTGDSGNNKEFSTNIGGSSTSRLSGVVNCVHCGSEIHNLQTATKRERTGEIFCKDCVVDTKCMRCGTPLTLSVPQYLEVDKTPICMECDKKRRSHEEGSSSSTDSTVKVPTFSIILLSIVVAGVLIWYFRPTLTVTVSPETIATIRTGVRTLVGPGLLVVLLVFYREIRGD